MKKLNSAYLLLIGSGLLCCGILADHFYLKVVLIVASMPINIFAVVRSFKEKKNNK